jgi:NADH-quinone oxidoreductase subunit K
MRAALLLVAVALFFLGLSGALVRRSLLVAVLSMQVASVGAVLAFVAFGVARGDSGGLARAVVVLFISVVHAVLGAAATIAVFRRRGTINLDELRELRG